MSAPVEVERAVHGWRQPDGGGPDPALGKRDQGVRGVDPWPAGQHVRLGGGPAQPGKREQRLWPWHRAGSTWFFMRPPPR